MIQMAKNKSRAPRSNVAAYKKMALEKALVNHALNAELSKAYVQGLNDGYGTAALILFWLLHTDYGFGKKRLALLMRKVNDFCIDVLGPGPDGQQKPKEGEFNGISLDDIAQSLKEECGIFIDTKTWMMEIDGIEIVRKEGAVDGGTGQAETAVR